MKNLILVAIKGKHHQQVFGPAMPQIIGAKEKELKKSGNWIGGWTFQKRTVNGYKNVPILTKKLKTYEDKIAAIKTNY